MPNNPNGVLNHWDEDQSPDGMNPMPAEVARLVKATVEICIQPPIEVLRLAYNDLVQYQLECARVAAFPAQQDLDACATRIMDVIDFLDDIAVDLGYIVAANSGQKEKV